jgi:hypothetical protein
MIRKRAWTVCMMVSLLWGGLYASDIKINDDTGTADQTSPCVAMSLSGHTVMCWQDERDEKNRVFFQILGRNGIELLSNQPVVEDPNKEQFNPSLAIDGHGRFIIVWQNDEDENATDVYYRRFAANGEPLENPINLTLKWAPTHHYSPDVDMNIKGKFVIVLIGKDSAGKTKVYHSLRHVDGIPKSQGELIDGALSAPKVSMNAMGQFAVAACDQSSGAYKKVIAQAFDAEAEPTMAVQQVSVRTIQKNHAQQPDISMVNSGDFLVCWQYCTSSSGFPWHIYSRYYESSSNEFKEIQQLSDFTTTYVNNKPTITYLNTGLRYMYSEQTPSETHLVTWSTDVENVASTLPEPMDIYYQKLVNGVKESVPIRVNKDTQKDQLEPAAAYCGWIDTKWTVWQDKRNGHSDIYARYHAPKSPLRLMYQMMHRDKIVLNWDPPYRTEGVSKYQIFKSERRDGPYTQVADIDLEKRGPLGMQLRDWVDTEVEEEKNYFYYITKESFIASSDTLSAAVSTRLAVGKREESAPAQTRPVIDGDIRQEEWQDATTFNKGQIVSYLPHMTAVYIKNDKNTLYIAIRDSNDTNLDPGNYLAICFDHDNNGKWPSDNTGNEGNIILRPGKRPQFVQMWGKYPDHLSSAPPKNEPGVEAVMTDEHGMVQVEIAIDKRSSHLQWNPGDEIGFSILLDDPGTEYFLNTGYLAVCGLDATFYNPATFSTLILASDFTAVDSELHAGQPFSFGLKQNYPNPFNPETKIRFNLVQDGYTTLTIYNLKGERVRQLLAEHCSKGNHSIIWDGRDDKGSMSASGIYLYTLRSDGETKSRKMMLIR